ncbi:ABC transporter ATP-binding protein [Lysinibacillus macroides]|uniref:ABC transporter ATP-binding protein n=1 Tax=Lysinibacillus macroides TaxID=33935 RepID=A0A0M9DJE6_9BACI|nr:ABC transporter ATP-binding protein [Lysinibacillus macroides]KOY81646.1 ABC transporter ATP-binding protein [Lysinibacillus macroides]QPR69507.1 ABC transporter ATP-binding protein [Lysinibacillus macroides]
MLSIQNIAKSFDALQVLEDLSFEVRDGEFVAIIGPSGSGKSTLFQLIGGVASIDKGAILLNEGDIQQKRGTIGYMPQQPSLLPWRTVLENVTIVEELQRKPNTERAKIWLKKVGLESFIHAYPHELSGGMQQRVSFIRAMVSDKPILCLDEPFSALDEFTRLEMQAWLLSIWEEYRKSILFVTHSIEEALFLADRILILTKRPASIKKEMIVPFARPRQEEIRHSTTFTALKQQLFTYLQEEKGDVYAD